MREKKTEELTAILEKTHVSDFERYCDENRESMVSDNTDFYAYVKEYLREKNLRLQNVFLEADVPERYGYKLLSGEKKTRQRDIILRICYAAEMPLEETQRALQKYGMARLYPKFPRDALLMIAFNERPGSIIEVNSLLSRYGCEPLRTSGVQD